jgi:hypothetical protein
MKTNIPRQCASSVTPKSDDATGLGSNSGTKANQNAPLKSAAKRRRPATFLGTESPCQLRVIRAVEVRPTPREEIDRIARCSNGPDLIAGLRELGLEIPCTRTKKLDRDMFVCWPGVYHLTEHDRRLLNDWKRRRAVQSDGLFDGSDYGAAHSS